MEAGDCARDPQVNETDAEEVLADVDADGLEEVRALVSNDTFRIRVVEGESGETFVC